MKSALKALETKEKGVDICLLMDGSGSMVCSCLCCCLASCSTVVLVRLAFDWHYSLVQRWCLEACKAKALEIMSAAETVHPDALTRVVRHLEQCMQLAAAATLLSLEG